MCVFFYAKTKWQGKTDTFAFNGNKIPPPRRTQVHTNTTLKIYVCKHQKSLQEKRNHLYKGLRRVITSHDRSWTTTSRRNTEIDAYQTTTNDSYFFPLSAPGVHGCWSALRDHRSPITDHPWLLCQRTPCLPHTDFSCLYTARSPAKAMVFEQAWEVTFNPFVVQSTVNSASRKKKKKLHDVNQDLKIQASRDTPCLKGRHRNVWATALGLFFFFFYRMHFLTFSLPFSIHN